jgi:type IX secretion system PorP/SprF family membrane protein
VKTHFRLLSAIGCLALFLPGAQAQIASRIDQYMQDPAIINPAAINSYSNARASLFYNRLYSNVNGSPGNMLLSLSAPIADRRIGLGGFFAQEKVGFTTLTNLYGTYAYTIPLGNKQRLNVAASLGMINQKFNGGVIDVVDPNDPVYQNYLRGQSTSRLDIKVFRAVSVTRADGGFQHGQTYQSALRV